MSALRMTKATASRSRSRSRALFGSWKSSSRKAICLRRQSVGNWRSSVLSESNSLFPLKKLGEVGVAVLDCHHLTPKAQEDGYPYIAIPDLKGGHIDLEGARRISPEDFRTWTKKTKPQAGDVIVTR